MNSNLREVQLSEELFGILQDFLSLSFFSPFSLFFLFSFSFFFFLAVLSLSCMQDLIP